MKHKLSLDIADSAYEGWAFLQFHTTMPNYVFVDGLNSLYDYRLERVDDMNIDDVAWPLYRFDDSNSHLVYFLVGRPAAATDAPWDDGDMVLVVKGENAAEMVETIYDDFNSRHQCDGADLLALQHEEQLNQMLSSFTLALQLDPDAAMAQRSSQRKRGGIVYYCDRILDHIEEYHLDLTDVERARLEDSK